MIRLAYNWGGQKLRSTVSYLFITPLINTQRSNDRGKYSVINCTFFVFCVILKTKLYLCSLN